MKPSMLMISELHAREMTTAETSKFVTTLLPLCYSLLHDIMRAIFFSLSNAYP